MSEFFDVLQWPAMAASLLAAWLVASNRASRRNAGFWIFLASNILWITWGQHDSAYALIVLQLGLATLNVRGVVKSRRAGQPGRPRQIS